MLGDMCAVGVATSAEDGELFSKGSLLLKWSLMPKPIVDRHFPRRPTLFWTF